MSPTSTSMHGARNSHAAAQSRPSTRRGTKPLAGCSAGRAPTSASLVWTAIVSGGSPQLDSTLLDDLLKLASAENGPHDFEFAVAGAVQVVVQHCRGVRVTDDEFDLVADARRGRRCAQLDARVLCRE